MTRFRLKMKLRIKKFEKLETKNFQNNWQQSFFLCKHTVSILVSFNFKYVNSFYATVFWLSTIFPPISRHLILLYLRVLTNILKIAIHTDIQGVSFVFALEKLLIAIWIS